MVQNATGRMILLKIESSNKDYLGGIRSWENLQIGKESEFYWVKGFTEQQLDSIELKSIPYKKLFIERDHLLFPMGSELPVSRLSNLLWSPIERGLPIETPDFNHNYFGMDSKISIRIKSTDRKEEESAMVLNLSYLKRQIRSVPEIRMKGLEWVVLDQERALIIGAPLLSVNGKAHWINGASIVPAGFNFEYPNLSENITAKLNPELDCWILWQENGLYALINKDNLRPLSRSAVRLTKQITPAI